MADNASLKAAMLERAKRERESRQQKTLGIRLWENIVGDDDPTTQNTGEKIGSFLNKAGESLTFGLVGDEASAAAESLLPGVDYEGRRDHYRQQEQILERDNPGAALTADLGGAVAGAALPFGAIGTLGRGAGLGARAAASAGAGALGAGTYGFMEGEGADNRFREAGNAAGIGAGIGLVAPLIGAGVQRAANSRAASKAMREAAKGAPTSEQLRRMGSQLYDDVDRAGVQIKAPAFDTARTNILDALKQNTAYTPRPGGRTITPNTSAVVDNMADMADEMAGYQGSALPFKEIDSLRRQAGAAAGNVANKADQQAGMTIIEGLDDFVKRLGPDDVATGDIQTLKTALPKAREIWQKMSKSQMLDDAIEQQDNYLSGGASAIRNRFASILRNPKLSRGFTEGEKKAMQRVVSGSIPQQLLNYLGSGLGMMGQIGMGAATGGGAGAIAGAGAGIGARKASEAVALQNAEIARAIVANGRLNTLPVASDSTRKIVESLLRRGGAVAAQ